jgi:4-amino-4-deoxy-L-arabinose transferase-like glycosyltransferase
MVDGLFLTLFGNNYLIARLPSVLMGSTACVVTYVIAKALSGRRGALLAGTILAVSGAYINRMALQDNPTELFLLATLLLYMRFAQTPKSGLKVGAGLTAGLALLSKYTGVVAPLFLLIQGGVDKKLLQLRSAFGTILLCALAYPIIGLILDWKGFVQDTLYQATREFSAGNLLYIISVGWPVSQLQQWYDGTGLVSFAFTTIGLLSTIYVVITKESYVVISKDTYVVIKERGKGNCLIGAAVLSLLIVLVAAGQVWWSSLILVLPFYAIATSSALLSIAQQVTPNKSRLKTVDRTARKLLGVNPGIVFLIVLLALFTASLYQTLMPSQLLGVRVVLVFLAAIGILIAAAYRAGFQRVLKIMVVAVMISMIIGAGVQASLALTTRASEDQMAIVKYLNAHTAKTDMVAANPSITWLLTCVGVNYAEVALYTTHEYTYLYGIELLPRFKMNISLSNFRFIVLDTPWLRDKIGGSSSVQELTPMILLTWRNVANIGDYRVYENPHGKVEMILYKVQGYVFAPDGITPLPRCWVSVYSRDFDTSWGSWTDEKGHYLFSTSGGTFIFDVWPPSTSDYSHYQEVNFIVSGSLTKNVTLTPKT